MQSATVQALTPMFGEPEPNNKLGESRKMKTPRLSE
jgi:hypothetical protein